MKLIVACRGAESDATVSFPHFISPVFQKLPDFDQNILKELIYKKKKFCKNTTISKNQHFINLRADKAPYKSTLMQI